MFNSADERFARAPTYIQSSKRFPRKSNLGFRWRGFLFGRAVVFSEADWEGERLTMRRGSPGRFAPVVVLLFGGMLAAGCGEGPPKTDAELGLNAQQAQGRAIFDHYCAPCHYAYSAKGNKGPGLKGLFGKAYLPSGLPANDRFVGQTVRGGRNMMPEFGDALTDEQFLDLMDYLHTL
jgi:mono/diheme cytochrome c family protein